MADDERKKISAVEEEKDSESGGYSSSETGSDVEFECVACDVRFSGPLPYKQHLRGKRHARTAARRKEEAAARPKEAEGGKLEFRLPEPFAACGACRKEFSGPESYNAHLGSKKHKQKVVEDSIFRQVSQGGEIDAEKLREELTRKSEHPRQSAATHFECDACEKAFGGLTPYAQHLAGKGHAKRTEGRRKAEEMAEGGSTIRLEEDDVLVCKACTVSFSGPQSAALHLRSKKHARQLDRYVRKLERKRERAAAEEALVKGLQLPDPSNDEDAISKDGNEKTSSPKSGEDISKSHLLESDDEADRYRRYKEYKNIMNASRQDDSGI